MKNINELTEQEILALTNDQLLNMVKLRMAEEGIKLIGTPKQPEYIPIPPKDVKMYKVGGFDFLFKDIADAEVIGNAISQVLEKLNKECYDNSDYTTKYSKPYTSDEYAFRNVGKIESEDIYSRETALSIMTSVKQNAKMRKDYEADLKAYHENYDSAQYIRDEVYGKFNEVSAKFQNFENMKSTFEQYLPLAGYNPDIALNFLKKAYTIDDETQAYVMEHATTKAPQA